MKKIISFLLRIFHIFPVKKNRISFICYDAQQFSCNTKYIADYILDKYGDKYELIWYYRNKNFKKLISDSRLKKCKYKSLRCIFLLLTSKFIITNISVPSILPYRAEQIKLNNWHGAAFKNYHSSGKIYEVAFKEKRAKDRKDVKESGQTTKSTYDLCEYFVAENELSANVITDSNGFNFHNKILKTGMPRNDIIIKSDKDLVSSIKKLICSKYNISLNSKILLYAPTFRDNCETDFCNLNFNSLQKSLQDKFGGEWTILARRHHLLKSLESEIWHDDLIDVSDYPDMQELLLIADILITDYSSCMWDFSLSPIPKPCFIYASDINRYINEDRGQFYYPIDELPFPLSVNMEELTNNVVLFDYSQYVEKVKEYHIKSGRFNYDGNATKKVVDLLLN